MIALKIYQKIKALKSFYPIIFFLLYTQMRLPVSFYVVSVWLGFLCVIFVCLWSGTWRGGFAWDGSFLQFNWHPVLMVTSLVVLYGNGEKKPLSFCLTCKHFFYCFLVFKWQTSFLFMFMILLHHRQSHKS